MPHPTLFARITTATGALIELGFHEEAWLTARCGGGESCVNLGVKRIPEDILKDDRTYKYKVSGGDLVLV